MRSAIAVPSTRCTDLRRKWARDVALEVRDAIRNLGAAHAIFSHGDDVHYRPIPVLVPVSWMLVGVYDEDACLSDIADDVMAATEREPMHAA
jgi:hypothetical protein